MLGICMSRSGKWTAAHAALGFCLVVVPVSAQAKRSCQRIEDFMRSAKMRVPEAELVGESALVDDGTIQHEVFVHTKDESYRDYENRDTWKANVAAYELAKILQVNIMPPYVEIKVNGRPASVAWGLDDVLMDEAERSRRHVQPPDLEAFNKQMYVIRVFDELLHQDRFPGDLLITRDWQLWIIGPSQGFRPNKTLLNPGNLVKCDRKLLAKMRTLDKAGLMGKLGNWLTKEEIEALHARAARIVEFFDREIAAKGEGAMLFDWDRSGIPCAF